ncbi:MAG: SusD/RagB family nutrient-binding outer membrane lipoprotein [Ginsengibacter sp.]
MKKLLILLFIPLLLFTACKKDFTSLNVNPKAPQTVPPNSLFTNAQHNLVNTITSSNVNLNIFRLVDQYWQEVTYTDESNYDIKTRPIPQSVWDALYRDVLQDLERSKILADVTDPAAVLANKTAMSDILQVYTYYYLITTFGNVPYSEALNVDVTTVPKYDDQKEVYYALLDRLDTDIAALDNSADGYGSSDILYGGDIDQWILFANSFKLKMGITIADFDDAKAKSVVESAVTAGVFASNADNASFTYLTGPPNTNPIWVDLVQSGRKDFVAASTIVDAMSTLNDPRLAYFFTPDFAGGYSGGDPGESSNYTTFSKPSDQIIAPDFPALLLSYDEVEFDLAEAAARGYSVGGTPMTHYDNAIKASIQYWGGTTTEATAYLVQPTVAYATAAGTYKQKIGIQKWIALYNRGWDGWIEIRRLDFPQLVAPASALSAFPVRLTYPVIEQNLNKANYDAAASAIGGDIVTTKLFWDKF